MFIKNALLLIKLVYMWDHITDYVFYKINFFPPFVPLIKSNKLYQKWLIVQFILNNLFSSFWNYTRSPCLRSPKIMDLLFFVKKKKIRKIEWLLVFLVTFVIYIFVDMERPPILFCCCWYYLELHNKNGQIRFCVIKCGTN